MEVWRENLQESTTFFTQTTVHFVVSQIITVFFDVVMCRFCLQREFFLTYMYVLSGRRYVLNDGYSIVFTPKSMLSLLYLFVFFSILISLTVYGWHHCWTRTNIRKLELCNTNWWNGVEKKLFRKQNSMSSSSTRSKRRPIRLTNTLQLTETLNGIHRLNAIARTNVCCCCSTMRSCLWVRGIVLSADWKLVMKHTALFFMLCGVMLNSVHTPTHFHSSAKQHSFWSSKYTIHDANGKQPMALNI